MKLSLFEIQDREGPRASAEFKLSITRALADQLEQSLRVLRPAPLNSHWLTRVQERPGIYELYLEEKRVYVGKASKNLRDRLNKHLKKLSGRSGIELSDVTFVCLYVDEDLEAAAPERMLIDKYRARGESQWNTMGFGNKDPGRNRDRTLVEAKHFDARYPIALDLTVDELDTYLRPVDDLLREVKARLPYTLRFETRDPIKRDLAQTRIALETDRISVRDLLREIISVLPDGWQATALPGYVILYFGSEDYRSATVYWRKEAGEVREVLGARQVDDSDAFPEFEDLDDE
ncbi:GIY-YIG nuclease family protein [Nocardia testacea]|uniref:GIY-YIG nuclease family protein n=1 Tax=Nocardia testacea TaxID=248551 RepID=UPI003A83A3A2